MRLPAKNPTDKSETYQRFETFCESGDELITLGGNEIIVLGDEASFNPPSTSSPHPFVTVDWLSDFCPFLAYFELNSTNRTYRVQETRVKRSLVISVSTLDFLSNSNNLLLDYGYHFLSFLSSANLISQSIVAGFDFAIAIFNLYNARKQLTFEGWLDEQIIQANYYNERILQLEEELGLEGKDKGEGNGSPKKYQELESVTLQLEQTIEDIQIRSRVYYHAELTGEAKTQNAENRIKTIDNKLQNLRLGRDLSDKESNIKKMRRSIYNSELTKEEQDRDKQIQTELEENYADCQWRCFIKGLIFASILTLTLVSVFCWPVLVASIIGGILSYGGITLYSAYYGKKAYKSLTTKTPTLPKLEEKAEEKSKSHSTSKKSSYSTNLFEEAARQRTKAKLIHGSQIDSTPKNEKDEFETNIIDEKYSVNYSYYMSHKRL